MLLRSRTGLLLLVLLLLLLLVGAHRGVAKRAGGGRRIAPQLALETMRGRVHIAATAAATAGAVAVVIRSCIGGRHG